VSVEPRPVGGQRCYCVSSAYCGITCDTFTQNYLFNNTLREENVLVYLRLRFRPLSGQIIIVALHEDYLSPLDESRVAGAFGIGRQEMVLHAPVNNFYVGSEERDKPV
jgi:hypothetical protein